MKTVLMGLALGGTTVASYALKMRPWLLSWGATEGDLVAALPGDEIVPEPRCTSSRAIEIAADPEDVWPWLAQLGQGRGGLYSYEWLENLFGCEIHNLDHVVPELQSVGPGDHIRLVPEDFKVDLSFEVAIAEPGQALVLKGRGSPEEAFAEGFAYPSWAFVIKPLGRERVRLIVRWRSDFAPTLSGYLWWKYGIEPVHFLMEQDAQRHKKKRAESLTANNWPAQTSSLGSRQDASSASTRANQPSVKRHLCSGVK